MRGTLSCRQLPRRSRRSACGGRPHGLYDGQPHELRGCQLLEEVRLVGLDFQLIVGFEEPPNESDGELLNVSDDELLNE